LHILLCIKFGEREHIAMAFIPPYILTYLFDLGCYFSGTCNVLK